jgi:gentisate 1,2-dioxygenase
VPAAQIDAAIAELASVSRAPGERRATEIVHPAAPPALPSFAPGLSVSINVLLPGETIVLPRDNATRVEFCIGGEGTATIGPSRLRMTQWDVWNIPSMSPRSYSCDDTQPFIWLSYSNGPLLERMSAYYADWAVPRLAESESPGVDDAAAGLKLAPDLPILSDGARLRGYEYLTQIEVVENKALLWPWREVEPHMATDPADGKRIIMLLYNPATERRNGTTHSFFATLGSIPPGHSPNLPARGHKHSSFACNYHFMGEGRSMIDGELVRWAAGDLLLSAPSWSEHAHGWSKTKRCAVLTVQDHPMHIGMESLIWQEKMDGPILTLGSEAGPEGYVGPRLEGD